MTTLWRKFMTFLGLRSPCCFAPMRDEEENDYHAYSFCTKCNHKC